MVPQKDESRRINAQPGSISRQPLRPKKKILTSNYNHRENERPSLHGLPSTVMLNNNHSTNTIEETQTLEKPITTLSNLYPDDSVEGLYRFKVHRQSSEGYSIQVGAYKEYGNVLRQTAILEEHFDQPIIIHISNIGNRPLYKVMVGEFFNRSEAIRFMKVVQAKGLEGMIKDLSFH